MEAVGTFTSMLVAERRSELPQFTGTDPGCGRMISEIVFLVSLTLSYTGYTPTAPHPLWKEFMFVLNFLTVVSFFPENTAFGASAGTLRNVFFKWQSPNCFGTTGAKQTGPHPDP